MSTAVINILPQKKQITDFSFNATEEVIGLWLSTDCGTTDHTVAVAAA